MMLLKEFKPWFDQQFSVLIEEKTNAFLAHDAEGSFKSAMFQIARLAKESNRLRSYVSYVGYITEGGDHDVYMLFAAIELLHMFCLVQEDGMEQSSLIGDILLVWFFECLHAIEAVEPYTVDDVIKESIAVSMHVIRDYLVANANVLYKQPSYLFEYSLSMGMVLAGADSEAIDFAKAYGKRLGDEEHAEESLEAIFEYNKDADSIWEELVEECIVYQA